jgi:RNA polymerase sigma-70 factor (ECF subfamily)
MTFSRNNIEGLIKGDEKAFEILVNTFSKKLFAYAISLSGDYTLSKDIVQEVFISTFEFRKRLDPN